MVQLRPDPYDPVLGELDLVESRTSETERSPTMDRSLAKIGVSCSISPSSRLISELRASSLLGSEIFIAPAPSNHMQPFVSSFRARMSDLAPLICSRYLQVPFPSQIPFFIKENSFFSKGPSRRPCRCLHSSLKNRRCHAPAAPGTATHR